MHKTMANIVYLIYRVQKFSEAQSCTPRSLYLCVCGTLHLSAQVSRVNNVVGDIWGGICGGLIISGNYFSFSSDTYKACPFKITSSSKPVETGILGFFCCLSSKIFLFERKGDEGGMVDSHQFASCSAEEIPKKFSIFYRSIKAFHVIRCFGCWFELCIHLRNIFYH